MYLQNNITIPFFWKRYWSWFLYLVELKQLSRTQIEKPHLYHWLSPKKAFKISASNIQHLKYHVVSTIWYPTFRNQFQHPHRFPAVHPDVFFLHFPSSRTSSANLVVPPQPSNAVIRCDTSKAPPEPWDTMACDIRSKGGLIEVTIFSSK